MAGLQWWCSARGTPWEWSWQAYPGVWLFMVGIAALAWPRASARTPARMAAVASGLVLLWVMLDWPLGPLGTAYLASVHALQFVVLAMIAPPLLLAGASRERIEHLMEGRAGELLRMVTQPLVAMIVFAVVMIGTHLPAMVDTLMRSQIGAFSLDTAWLAAGVIFWWPVVVPVPVRPRFAPGLRMLYLFFGTQAHLFIAMWLLVADFPVYRTYELAVRVTSLAAREDQQVAGGVMLAIGGTFVLGAISVIFFRWANAAERDAAGSPVRR